MSVHVHHLLLQLNIDRDEIFVILYANFLWKSLVVFNAGLCIRNVCMCTCVCVYMCISSCSCKGVYVMHKEVMNACARCSPAGFFLYELLLLHNFVLSIHDKIKSFKAYCFIFFNEGIYDVDNL